MKAKAKHSNHRNDASYDGRLEAGETGRESGASSPLRIEFCSGSRDESTVSVRATHLADDTCFFTVGVRKIGEVAFESGKAAKRTNDRISGALEFRGKAKPAYRERPSIMLIWN